MPPSSSLGRLDGPLLRVESLRCGYTGREVLRGVEFEVHRGEVVALLGPNGSGKSTLLRSLSGLLPSLAGRISISGREIDQIAPRERGQLVGYVPQEETPVFPYSVREVVVMGRMVHGEGLWESEDDLRQAEEAMALADCLSLADRSILELSGGERQRVLLARCLAQQTPLVLLDEPTSHSDFSHQVAMAEILCRLVGEGRGILLALHDLNQAFLSATRCLVVSQGEIVADGPPADVLVPELLETVYGCRFERVVDSMGKIRVFPSLPLTPA